MTTKARPSDRELAARLRVTASLVWLMGGDDDSRDIKDAADRLEAMAAPHVDEWEATDDRTD